MKRIVFLITAFIMLLTNVQLYSQEIRSDMGKSARILASDFPKTASRVMFFEERINSKDSSVRERVLVEAGGFYCLPDKEYVSFLRSMYNDPDPIVRGRAIKTLYGMWIPQSPSELPSIFTGYSDDLVINKKIDAANPDLIVKHDTGSAYAGYDAYSIGLLCIKEAIPYLKGLGSTDNVFVRYTAARALFDCGDKLDAIAIFDKISSEQLAIYASGKTYEDNDMTGRTLLVSPFYAASACQGLVKIGGSERDKGLQRLIRLMEFLEKSEEINDQSNLHWVRNILAVESGKYFTTSEDALQWLSNEQKL